MATLRLPAALFRDDARRAQKGLLGSRGTSAAGLVVVIVCATAGCNRTQVAQPSRPQSTTRAATTEPATRPTTAPLVAGPRPLSALLTDLASGDASTRAAAAAGMNGLTASADIEIVWKRLVAATLDPSPLVRRNAVAALATMQPYAIGARSEYLQSAIVGAMGDRDPGVAATARAALPRAVTDTADIIAARRVAIDIGKEIELSAARGAVEERELASRTVLPLPQLKPPPPPPDTPARQDELFHLASRTGEGIDMLVSQLHESRDHVAGLLTQLGPSFSAALTPALLDENPARRSAALEVLEQWDASAIVTAITTSPNDGAGFFTALHTAILQEKSAARAKGLPLLAAFGERAIPALIAELSDPSSGVGTEAFHLLRRLDPKMKQTLPVLLELLAGDDLSLRIDAANDLAELGPAAAPAVPLLSRMATNRYFVVSGVAVHALLKIDRSEATLGAALVSVVQNGDERGAMHLAEALPRPPSQRLLSRLKELSKDESEVKVREAAQRVLAELALAPTTRP